MATERIETEIDTTGKSGGQVIVESQDEPDSSTSTGDELQVIVKDDRPEEDRDRKPYTGKTAVPSDEEIGEYTKGVQERLRTMRREYHDVRRERDDYLREHGAAIDFAKRIHAENEQLRKLLAQGHQTMIQTAKTSAENEMKALQESLKVALEQGNTELAANLQGKLSMAAARAEAQNHIQPIQFQERPWPQQQQGQPQGQPAVQISRKLKQWMNENPWFQENQRMTGFALGVHDELIADGVEPESEEYFKELQKATREAFPNYEGWASAQQNSSGSGQSAQNRRATPVSGAARSAAGARRSRVELTASEARLAKRMGLTLEQYAQEKVRLENTDG